MYTTYITNLYTVLSRDTCEYAATSTGLRQHIESKHEGARYPCDKCEHAATTAGSLKRRIEIKHEGVSYPCDKCEYAATTTGSLKQHIDKKHKGQPKNRA